MTEPNYWLMKSEPDAYSIDTLKDAWRLGVLHVEYEKLKKILDQQQQ